MTRLVIIGAGGHGREVADIVDHAARVDGGLELLGYVDEDESLTGRELEHGLVLGTFDWFVEADRRELRVLPSIGSVEAMATLARKAGEIDLEFATLVSPSATVSPSASLGVGTVVFPGAVVGPSVRLGRHVIVNVGASVSHDSEVGDFVNINPGARLAGNVSVGDAAYLGMGASVIQGQRIGSGARVGAGAVVIRDVEANTTVVGVPARPISHRSDGWWRSEIVGS